MIKMTHYMNMVLQWKMMVKGSNDAKGGDL